MPEYNLIWIMLVKCTHQGLRTAVLTAHPGKGRDLVLIYWQPYWPNAGLRLGPTMQAL